MKFLLVSSDEKVQALSTLGLLNSMINSGESHSKTSKSELKSTREILEKDRGIKIDFALLREQKEALSEVILAYGESKDKSQKDTAETLDGVLGLLDEIQDLAVDHFGVSEEEVFGL
ncbi:hypothetical protein [Flammeovirga agarivorans]|uniref:Uncharacterized protein n=1 Tax=Flammeovirga agarivorans TaxID=2726742 RepID=A0A7X8XZ79_9BACT|nr:hypothetical protein [Flammeovirga agarivorans]NLR94909.1 hypothetical protein [Flammeovirga agarivorans]